jgi:hypothetical protein
MVFFPSLIYTLPLGISVLFINVFSEPTSFADNSLAKRGDTYDIVNLHNLKKKKALNLF